MSTMATEFELKELEQRIAAADAEIVSKQDAVDERMESLRESGVTSKSISVEDAKELADAQKEIDGLKDEAIVLRDFRQTILGDVAAKRGPGNREGRGTPRSFHELVFGAAEYAHLTPDRILGSSQLGALPAVEVFSRETLMFRLSRGLPLFADTADALLDAGIPLDERLYPPVDILRRQIRLLDLITVGATTSDTVVYARQTTRDSGAAETAYGTAYGEASFEWEQVTATVRDIGHWTSAYRSNIADAGQFDTIVRRQLQEDVLLRLESQIYAGTGVGVNLKGITAESIESVDRDTTNETRIDVIHRAMTKIRNNFVEPQAIVLHPNDYEDIVLEKDEVKRPMLLGQDTAPTGAPYLSLWGLPMVVTPVATEGTGLVGYFRDATLWMRSGVALSVSDSHADFFTKRMVAILAELRGAFSVQRPGAFCKVNFI